MFKLLRIADYNELRAKANMYDTLVKNDQLPRKKRKYVRSGKYSKKNKWTSTPTNRNS
jgi:hypothetical protein